MRQRFKRGDLFTHDDYLKKMFDFRNPPHRDTKFLVTEKPYFKQTIGTPEGFWSCTVLWIAPNYRFQRSIYTFFDGDINRKEVVLLSECPEESEPVRPLSYSAYNESSSTITAASTKYSNTVMSSDVVFKFTETTSEKEEIKLWLTKNRNGI